MKQLLLISILTGYYFNSHSQQYLVPYNAGNKWGLVSETGKMVVQAGYEAILWQGDKYFTALKRNPEFQNESGQRRFLATLFYGMNPIIKDSAYEQFIVKPKKYIIANSHFPWMNKNHSNLFTLSGKQIPMVDFSAIEEVFIQPEKQGYILFRATQFDNKETVFIYDVEKGKVVDWVLKNASSVKIINAYYHTVKIIYENGTSKSNFFYLTVNENSYKRFIEIPQAKTRHSTMDGEIRISSMTIETKSNSVESDINDQFDSVKYSLPIYQYNPERKKIELYTDKRNPGFEPDELYCGYKNGSCFLLSANKKILNEPFDEIGKPGSLLSINMERVSTDHCILKKDGLYGLILYAGIPNPTIGYISPKFQYIPRFYFSNYYGIEGLKIYGLHSTKDRFLGFANEAAFLFFDPLVATAY